jgi:hypothetical protein
MIYVCSVGTRTNSTKVDVDAEGFHAWLAQQGMHASFNFQGRCDQLSRFLLAGKQRPYQVVDWSMEEDK